MLRKSSTAIVEVVHCNCTSIRVVPPPLLRKASTASPQIHFCKNSSLSRRVSIIARSRVLRCCYTGLPPLLQNSTTNILQPKVRRHFCESPSSFFHESVINFAWVSCHSCVSPSLSLHESPFLHDSTFLHEATFLHESPFLHLSPFLYKFVRTTILTRVFHHSRAGPSPFFWRMEDNELKFIKMSDEVEFRTVQWARLCQTPTNKAFKF